VKVMVKKPGFLAAGTPNATPDEPLAHIDTYCDSPRPRTAQSKPHARRCYRWQVRAGLPCPPQAGPHHRGDDR
jgi:hypothetical protein